MNTRQLKRVFFNVSIYRFPQIGPQVVFLVHVQFSATFISPCPLYCQILGYIQRLRVINVPLEVRVEAASLCGGTPRSTQATRSEIGSTGTGPGPPPQCCTPGAKKSL